MSHHKANAMVLLLAASAALFVAASGQYDVSSPFSYVVLAQLIACIIRCDYEEWGEFS